MALAVMRRHRRWLFIFLWVVIAAFIILYIPAFQGVTDSNAPGATVATVAGKKITVGDVRRAYLRQRQMIERMYRGRIDAAMLKSLGLEEQALDALVEDRVVALEAERLGLRVDDADLEHEIVTAPEFQENGRFMGKGEIKRRLELQGMSVEEFEATLRSQILRRRLEALITDGVVVTPADVEKEYRRRTEQVKAEYVLVDAARFLPQVSASEDEVKARFDKDKEAYRIPERRVVSYLQLDPESLRARVTVADAEIGSFYTDHAHEFRQEEEACAAHVLVKVRPGDAGGEAGEGHTDAEARTIAEGVLAQLKGGADFAAVAKKVSEDRGSAERGGDLGCFKRGAMVGPFDAAVFELQPGQLSDLVKTDFGYHVIRLQARHEEAVRPLAQVKEQIRAQLQRQSLSKLLDERAESLGGALRKGKSLEEVAAAEGLTVKKTAPFARGDSPKELPSPAVSARAFKLEAKKTDGDPVSVGGGIAFLRVDEIQKARVPELKEVQDKVKADLLHARAAEKAKALADDLRARAGKDGLDKAATALGLVRKETPQPLGRGQAWPDVGASAAVEDAAFALAAQELSAPVLSSAGWVVLRVLEKKGFDPVEFEPQRASLTASLREEKQNQLFRSYLEQARTRFPVEKDPSGLRRVVG